MASSTPSVSSSSTAAKYEFRPISDFSTKEFIMVRLQNSHPVEYERKILFTGELYFRVGLTDYTEDLIKTQKANNIVDAILLKIEDDNNLYNHCINNFGSWFPALNTPQKLKLFKIRFADVIKIRNSVAHGGDLHFPNTKQQGPSAAKKRKVKSTSPFMQLLGTASDTELYLNCLMDLANDLGLVQAGKDILAVKDYYMRPI